MRATRWGLAIVLALGAGCSIPDTSQRGFGSKQVLHIRDDGLGLRTFSVDLASIYLAHAVPGISTSNGVNAPYDRTLLDLTTGLETPIAMGVLNAYLVPDATGPGRSLVTIHFLDDASIPVNLTPMILPFMTLTFMDEMTGTKIDVQNVNSQYVVLGSTRADPVLVGIATDQITTRPWTGLPGALKPMPPEVNLVDGRDHQGFVTLTPGQPSSTQVFTRYPFDPSGTPTTITPALLSARTFVTGDDGSPTNTGVATLPGSNVTPSIFCPPPVTAGAALPNCLLFYDRDLDDGTSAGFVHFLDDGREMQLPGALTNHLADTLAVSPTGGDVFWLNSESGGTETRLYTWHVGDSQTMSCVVPRTVDRRNFSGNAWQPGTGRFVTVAQSNSQSASAPGSWALIEGTAGAGCRIVTSGDNLINQVLFSPSGAQFAMLETDPAGASKVYLGLPDGSVPAVAATGVYYFNIDYHDARHLLLWHSNTNGYSLSWLDVTTSPVAEHAIADRVRWDARTSWAWLTPTWVLLADADLEQDGSYSLDVVNIDTGEERLVSRGVVDFRASWATPPPGATDLGVVYTVRSRTASSQDGIWLAHIPLGDFAE